MNAALHLPLESQHLILSVLREPINKLNNNQRFTKDFLCSQFTKLNQPLAENHIISEVTPFEHAQSDVEAPSHHKGDGIIGPLSFEKNSASESKVFPSICTEVSSGNTMPEESRLNESTSHETRRPNQLLFHSIHDNSPAPSKPSTITNSKCNDVPSSESPYSVIYPSENLDNPVSNNASFSNYGLSAQFLSSPLVSIKSIIDSPVWGQKVIIYFSF
ncbi:unnamed protein product [Protopolystoma xenopodis]|uniref:Uncharacterized protein n=1 Tax=Protopolystoma xenopodis TaxID=117903 RepID=A0A448X5N0_9PLAT|nr:unnamed protein product [Protopolystoma xenopodis]